MPAGQPRKHFLFRCTSIYAVNRLHCSLVLTHSRFLDVRPHPRDRPTLTISNSTSTGHVLHILVRHNTMHTPALDTHHPHTWWHTHSCASPARGSSAEGMQRVGNPLLAAGADKRSTADVSTHTEAARAATELRPITTELRATRRCERDERASER